MIRKPAIAPPEQQPGPTPGDDARDRRGAVAAHFDRYAHERAAWRRRGAYYHETLLRTCRQFVAPGQRVLELGCNTGDLLAGLAPSVGVGVDISSRSLAVARAKYPNLHFVEGEAEAPPFGTAFDSIIMADLLGHVDDVWRTFRSARAAASADTRIIVTTYNFVWRPAFALAEQLGLKMPLRLENWLGAPDVENLLDLAHLEVEARGHRLLSPIRLPGPNRWLEAAAEWPGLRHLAVLVYWVARPRPQPARSRLSCSVIVPCRNERGNIDSCVARVPKMGTHTEIVFVDGASTDGTRERIQQHVAEPRADIGIRLIDQVPTSTGPAGATSLAAPASPDVSPLGAMSVNGAAATPLGPPDLMLALGKGDAVRKGFAAARGDVLMILDADLTVAPEELPKFYAAVAEGVGDFANGSRLVYPLADEAMRFLNLGGNKLFSLLFTWLLGQRIKDTLCGTKVLRQDAYERLAQQRDYFGEFDPFGDFDLLFGAARLVLKIVEVPVRYRRRTYGSTKVRVLSHGILLLRMSWLAFRRLKLAAWTAGWKDRGWHLPRQPSERGPIPPSATTIGG